MKCSIIVSSNSKEDKVKKCVDAIKEHHEFDYELVLVDNRHKSIKQFPDLQHGNYIETYRIDSDKVISSSHNLGCSRGWQLGAYASEGDVLVFIVDGVIAQEDIISLLLVTALESSVGMVGYGGGYREVNKSQIVIQSIPGPLNEPIEVDEISGFLWATRSDVFFEVGGLDVRFSPSGHEETDYAFKVRDAGYKCIRLPRQAFDYTPNSSSKPKRVRWLSKEEWTRPTIDNRNKRLFFKKWANFNSLYRSLNV